MGLGCRLWGLLGALCSIWMYKLVWSHPSTKDWAAVEELKLRRLL